MGIPNEAKPIPAVPESYFPKNGTRYPVKEGETWVSIARPRGIDPWDLIDFNFPGVKRVKHTSHELASRQVNWYLHYYLGCEKSTDGQNWAFSSGLRNGKGAWKGGYIFVPPVNYDFDAEVITASGPPGRNALAKFLDKLPEKLEDKNLHFWHRIHFGLDVYEFVHMSLGVIPELELGVAGAGIEVAGPLLAEAAFWVGMGLTYVEAWEKKRRDYTLSGISQGIVMGADRADLSWVSWTFKKQPRSVQDSQFPDKSNMFVNAYNWGLQQGLKYGRILNSAESAKLMQILRVKAGYSADEPDDIEDWSDVRRRNYYIDVAATFRRDFMPK